MTIINTTPTAILAAAGRQGTACCTGQLAKQRFVRASQSSKQILQQHAEIAESRWGPRLLAIRWWICETPCETCKASWHSMALLHPQPGGLHWNGGAGPQTRLLRSSQTRRTPAKLLLKLLLLGVARGSTNGALRLNDNCMAPKWSQRL